MEDALRTGVLRSAFAYWRRPVISQARWHADASLPVWDHSHKALGGFACGASYTYSAPGADVLTTRVLELAN